MLYLLDLNEIISKSVEVVPIVNKCVCKSMNVFCYGKIKTELFVDRMKVFLFVREECWFLMDYNFGCHLKFSKKINCVFLLSPAVLPFLEKCIEY